MKIILASASPRRSALLRSAGVDFKVVVSHAQEIVHGELPPQEIVMDIARQKALPVSASYPDNVVVACDTMVWMNGQMLGKPKDHDDAVRMLTMLSGHTHYVFSGVCIKRGQKERRFYDKTSVTFVTISPEEMERYIATGEPFDKAGAYAMQEKGSVFVKKIGGCPSNVVGLPLWKLMRELKDFTC